MQVLSIGEILWDIFPNRELLGGAALNFSANIQRLGDSAGLLTAVGDDPRGRAAYKAMQQLGLATDFVQTASDLATGVAQVNTTSDGEPSFEIPRPAAFDGLSMTADLRAAAFSLETGLAILRYLAPNRTSCGGNDRIFCEELARGALLL